MLYEYALISVLIASGYWGIFFLRRQPSGTPTFGIMQLAAAALAGLGLLGRDDDHADHGWLDVAGAIGLGAGLCLLVVGPMVRALARRFAAAERLGIAGKLLDVAELLAPGSGVAEEKAVLGAMREIRDGRVEETVEALTAAKDRAPAEARVAIDERIALLYLAAYRWKDAIAHAETHLLDKPVAAPADHPASLRHQLGIAPPVWVELLGAYARTGNLDEAARMLARLEDVCGERPDAALWVHRARLMFLALAGRPAAVQQLVHPRQARHMSVAARTYWVAVAHEHHGDRAAATAAYEKARGHSRGRPRELIDKALAALAAADGQPVELSPVASEIVARIEAAPLPAPIRVPRVHRPWATWLLSATLLGVAGAIYLFVGPSSDPGALVRGGATVRGLVEAGEWWRLVACVFVHVGGVHLFVNVIGLYFLGRVAEELFGFSRTVALFGIAGIAGAVASYLASPAGISAGASGAIFGLLGAVFIELTWHRDHYRAAWKRGMWGGLVVVTVAQVGVGFLYPVIDQWAHGVGLVSGVAFGALFSPHAKWAKASIYVGRAVALMVAAFSITAATLVAQTSIADSLARDPLARHVVGEVAVMAPASWNTDGELSDRDGLVIMTISKTERTGDVPGQVLGWLEQVPKIASAHGFAHVEAAPDRVIALPGGWEGTERIGSFDDAMGNRQHYRIVAAVKAFDRSLVAVVLMTSDSMARAAPGFFASMIGSTQPVD